MQVSFLCDGTKIRVSKSGKPYAELYVRELTDGGEADFEQHVYRSFEESVVQECQKLKPNTVVVADLEIREALVTHITTELM